MTMFLTIAVVVLIFIVIFQISKASEYVSVINGNDTARKQSNKINGFLMLGFMIFGLIGVWYCNELLYHKTLMAQPAASNHGEKVDEMLKLTIVITGIVFIITQVLLFWFSYKYQEKEGRKVFHFAHSSKLEAVWTAIPAIVLAILVIIGLKNWYAITGDAPKNALEVEVVGKQFGWIFRYKGNDNQFGKKYFKIIDNATNPLGLIWEDNEKLNLKKDTAGFDDVVVEQTLYLIKDRPVRLIIGSRDVIHDVGLSHFRMKMDAVPGTPTTMWFTPKYTTAEMKEITKNPNFVYEISCDQMCGNGHYSMKGTVEVVTQAQYDAWMAKQQSAYSKLSPKEEVKPAIADTTKPAIAAVSVANKPIAKNN